ncbi:MAG: IS5 family transposase [Chloroflexia bacterium]|nr:IS5 family transposase [Bacteroidales bacterium]NJO89347.1 IS5 family transposase [Chloroflexia bacterium]
MKKYKQQGESGLFGEQFRLEKLSNQGDPLERLNKVINWDLFAPILTKLENTDKKNNAGAKPFNPLLMFKILILQRYYNLSDGQIEYQILDRLSFSRFLGLTLNDRVPDEKTVWAFKERLTGLGLEKELFNAFNVKLEENNLIAHQGKIIDASFVEMPRQRNSREENKHIKETGTAPASWDEEPNKKRQKDIDARWTKKDNESHYGYKDHAKVDNKHKFIDKYMVTDASVHDSQALGGLLDEKTDQGKDLWADSAYTGNNQDKTIEKYKMNNKVCEKGTRNNPLTQEQKASNREKSKVRSRVEHVFGFIEGSMNRFRLNCIGVKRASTAIGLINLTYNLFRYEQLVRLHGITMSNF